MLQASMGHYIECPSECLCSHGGELAHGKRSACLCLEDDVLSTRVLLIHSTGHVLGTTLYAYNKEPNKDDSTWIPRLPIEEFEPSLIRTVRYAPIGATSSLDPYL